MKAIRIYGSSGHATVSLDEVAVPTPAAEAFLIPKKTAPGKVALRILAE
jgi:hypothetical protein